MSTLTIRLAFLHEACPARRASPCSVPLATAYQSSENLHGITRESLGADDKVVSETCTAGLSLCHRRTAMIATSPAPEVPVTAGVQGDGAESSSHQGDTILGKTALCQA